MSSHHHNQPSRAWLPPGAEKNAHTFEQDFGENFYVPQRLIGKRSSLVNAVNDFHFAMMNDHDRNEFYRKALSKSVKPGTTVLEVGAGSGLLSMIAAKSGAEHVYAVEASTDLVRVASQCIASNNLSRSISLINKLSTEVEPEEIGGRADILVSEILGTMLLGEGALDYVADARQRLLKPNATIIPACGCQFATLIESPDIESITSVKGWNGIDLQKFNQLKDSVSLVFSKQYGFRMSSVPYAELSDRIPVVEIDFAKDEPGCVPPERRIRIRAKRTGVIHAVMCTWDVYSDHSREEVMSTEPKANLNNFPRDMQWGQALQLIEDHCKDDLLAPQPIHVTEGEELDLIVIASTDGVELQFLVEKVSELADEEGGEGEGMDHE